MVTAIASSITINFVCHTHTHTDTLPICNGHLASIKSYFVIDCVCVCVLLHEMHYTKFILSRRCCCCCIILCRRHAIEKLGVGTAHSHIFYSSVQLRWINFKCIFCDVVSHSFGEASAHSPSLYTFYSIFFMIILCSMAIG